MNSLTLDKALELYEILGAHIPEVEDKMDAWDFIGKIIDNIDSSEDRTVYSLAMELMSGKTLQEIRDMESEDRIRLFADGLIQNRILDLKSFCDTVGFSYG